MLTTKQKQLLRRAVLYPSMVITEMFVCFLLPFLWLLLIMIDDLVLQGQELFTVGFYAMPGLVFILLIILMVQGLYIQRATRKEDWVEMVKMAKGKLEDPETNLLLEKAANVGFLAASLMTPEFVEFHERTKIVDALQMIRETAMEKETLDVIYVIDQTHHLTGFTTLYKLITADEQAQVADCMDKNVLSVHTLDDKEQVARTFTRYDLSAMPVVDHEGRLVGLITVDDIVDVIQDENTEDMEIMAAMTPSEKPYLKTSVFDLAKHRVLWLLILMVSATVTGRIISYYDGLLQTAVVLASFIPMLMDTGGNCGSQASVMVIRGLALGEVEMRDILRVLWKELRVGLLVGVVLSVVNFGRIMLFESVGIMVALTVSLSLFVTVVVAKCIGCSLPIVARRCGFDPAVMASPFITTIVDAISLVVFFNIATNLLHLAA